MKVPHDSGLTGLNRREMMRLLGVGAGLGVVSTLTPRTDLFASPIPQGAAVTFPPGAVIRTVLGDVNPTSITGITLHHEHLGSGRPGGGPNAPKHPARKPGEDVEWMAEEISGIKTKYNVSCIVDALTGFPNAETRDYLKDLSTRTGVQLVLSGGYYMGSSYKPETKAQSEDQVADGLVQMAKEFGMGAFGEIGISNNEADLTADEKKVMRAVGKASARTGLPIFTHSNYATGPMVPNDSALRQLDAILAGGADPKHVICGHLDCLFEPYAQTAIAIAKRGAFVGFDRVTRQQQMVSNEDKARVVKAFIDAGYVNNLVLSSDYNGSITLNNGEVEMHPGPYWYTDGGPGWARSIAWFDPILRELGVTEAQMHTIRYDNERRWLAFVPKNG